MLKDRVTHALNEVMMCKRFIEEEVDMSTSDILDVLTIAAQALDDCLRRIHHA